MKEKKLYTKPDAVIVIPEAIGDLLETSGEAFVDDPYNFDF